LIDFERLEQVDASYIVVKIRRSNLDDPAGYVHTFFEVIHFGWDPLDTLPCNGQPPLISAMLVSNGTAVEIIEPRVPSFMSKSLRAMSKFNSSFEEGKKADLVMKLNKYKQAPTTRKTTILFPAGVVGETKYIGGVKGPLENENKLEVFSTMFPIEIPTGDGQTFLKTHYIYHSIKIGIKNTIQRLDFDTAPTQSTSMNEMRATIALLAKAHIGSRSLV
jgi:hypothetical protein